MRPKGHSYNNFAIFAGVHINKDVMKKTLKVIATAIVGIIVLLIATVLIVWAPEIRTIGTLESVEGNPYLYEMEYKAAYDLDDVIAHNIGANANLLDYVSGRILKGLPISISKPDKEPGSFACTSFQAKNTEGGFLFGRNYDFFKNPSLVTISRPKSGYASIAMTDLSHLGYGMDKLPEKFASKLSALASIYAPVDGMNEKGLCVSIMALPKQPAQQNTDKPVVGTTIIMRLILDRCATVAEAIEMVNRFDIRHDVNAGSGYHYMVADASGACAVIEFDLFDGWKTLIVEKPEGSNYMLVTNHLLSPKYYTTEPDPVLGNPHSRSWWRYETADGFLSAHEGTLSLEDAQECLSLVHWKDLVWPDGTVEDTQFSNVYDQTALTLSIRDWADYDTTVTFSLK